MSDDVFRIVVTAAVSLASLAFLVQAGVAIALYRVSRNIQDRTAAFMEKVEPAVAKAGQTLERAGPVIERIGPVIQKLGPVLDQAGPVVQKVGGVVDRVAVFIDQANSIAANTDRIVQDVRPRIAEISTETVGIAKSGREQVERLGNLLNDAGDRARMRLEQIDHAVESTVEQVEHVGDSVKRAVLRPVREVNGLAAGISAVVSTLVRGARKSSVDSATQDEEMFI
jgi:ABC-type transporter Mla subunit MlaD